MAKGTGGTGGGGRGGGSSDSGGSSGGASATNSVSVSRGYHAAQLTTILQGRGATVIRNGTQITTNATQAQIRQALAQIGQLGQANVIIR